MTTLCFATNNPNKLQEIVAILEQQYRVKGLKDIGCSEELPETKDTLEGNSLQKSTYVFDNYNVECFADDTGLEVEALNNAPGVYSARYAGAHRSNADNIELLLQNLESKSNRKARFRTVVTFTTKQGSVQFEGIAEGEIIPEPRGDKGFGYDAVFVPKGYDRTFAEMTAQEKNELSHRGKAIVKFADYLLTQKVN